MPVELKVPSVGESITEVQIGDWLKGVGERVRRDETVVMIETDKVTVELPAPIDGVISEIRVQKGALAQVGDVIGMMDEAGAQVAAAPSASAPTPVAAAPSPPTPVAAAPAPPAPSAPAPVAAPSTGDDDGRAKRGVESLPPQGFARVMPSARRVMAQSGLSVEQVQASGPGGRILKEDVMRAQAAPTAPAPSVAKAPPAPPAPPGQGEEIVAMSPMRKRIAERLVQSQQTAALLTTFNEIDMSAVIDLRKQYQPKFQEKYGIKLGFMSFFVKAAIEALKLIPEVNGEIRGTDIVYKHYYDIGVAVGGGKGLVVPVIRAADQLSFAQVELTIADYGRRAQDNKLALDELMGGTFTISNGGIYGSLMSTPIINPPQSGILGLHAIQERPVARDGQVVIRPMMYVALTYDHRLIDGREAVTFLKRIKECIEDPTRILLEV
ncbi:MAG: 2-oxoglutarate dehydrogenase complex dihydrolipoyllysine-residue succinyltransferase [Polyangiaceae bacterium]